MSFAKPNKALQPILAEREGVLHKMGEPEERLSSAREDAEECVAILKRNAACKELTREVCLQQDALRETHIYYKFLNYENLTDFR